MSPSTQSALHSAEVADRESPSPAMTSAPADIDRLFRQHNDALLRFVAAKLGSEQEAKDVAQEAYVRLLGLQHREAISYLRAFLFKTASNLALDRLRARRSTPVVVVDTEEGLSVFDLSPERQVAGEQLVGVLSEALAELPRKCRQVLLLHRLEGLSRTEIAQRMGLGERMVRLYMARALEHLRARLGEPRNGVSDR
jgi:RNA polymerase sigma factor (sigma-70 family)